MWMRHAATDSVSYSSLARWLRLRCSFGRSEPRISTGSAPKRRSIAVLVLKNLTSRPESDWYSTALAETIAGELGAGGDLRIISSVNVRRMQQELSLPGVLITPSQMKDIRTDIGCDLVLSGSYLTMGDKIRAELKLSDARTSDALASVTASNEQSKLLAKNGSGPFGSAHSVTIV